MLAVAESVVYRVAADRSRLDVIAETPGVTTVAGSPGGTRVAFAVCLGRPDVRQAAGRDAPAVRTYAAGQVRITGEDVYEIRSWNSRTGATRPLAAGRAPAWSPDGARLAFLSGYDYGLAIAERPGGQRLYVMPAEGGRPREVARSVVGAVTWSPDGQRLGFLVGRWWGPADEPGPALHFAGEDGTVQQRLATDVVSPPAWSPDGRRLAYARDEGDTLALYTVGVNGSKAQRVTTIQGWQRSPTRGWIPSVAWSPDGAYLLYSCGVQVCVVALDGTPVGRSPVGATLGAWSPDGSRVAVASASRAIPAGRHSVVLASMTPDGGDVQPLVRQAWNAPGRGVALWPGGIPPTPAPVYNCANGQVVPEPGKNPGLVHDCWAMVEALDALGADALQGKWSPSSPIGQWEGVGVSGTPPRVRSLNLSGQNFRGERIPAALFRLDALERLNLSRTHVVGHLPAALGDLTALRVLDLSQTEISGPIPPDLGRLTRLTHLVLRDDRVATALHGPLPRELGQLVALEVLDIAGHQLTGGIPPELGQLANLRVLDLSGNQLSGEIPVELAELDNLQGLFLGSNPQTGCIPAALRNVPDNDLDALPTCAAS